MNSLEIIHQTENSTIYRQISDSSKIIKVLNSINPSDLEAARFRHEYHILKDLNHPNIIKVYEIGAFNGHLAFWMEDIKGTSIEKIGMPLPFGQFLKIAMDICKALAYVHQKGLIHKHICPQHIITNADFSQIRLIDFGIACSIPKEQQAIDVTAIEGTWPYMSPEQTGRINRPLDFRSDFYSLGLSFFQMLTGRLAFEGNDSLDWFSLHMTQKVPNISTSDIPKEMNNIIAALTEKMADRRYQSSYGLLYDLNYIKNMQKNNLSSNFTIQSKDFSDIFSIPDKVYGRESEVELLTKNLKLMFATDQDDIYKPLVMILGSSGIGKSYLIKELQKPVTIFGGILSPGKFEQSQNQNALYAIKQSLQSALKEAVLLSPNKSSLMIENMANEIKDSLKIIVHWIPELKAQFGDLPQPIILEGDAAKFQILTSFQQYITFFTKFFPLILFIDDLQWSDKISVELIAYLLHSKIKNLLIVGTVRDQEISSHISLLELIDNFASSILNVSVKALPNSGVEQLLRDTLKSDYKLQEITNIIAEKSKGSPFYLRVLLKQMFQDNIITVNHEQRRWEIDLSRLSILKVSEDVVGFVVSRFKNYGDYVQNFLIYAAALGHRFTLYWIKESSELTTSEVLEAAKILAKEQVIAAKDLNYKFILESEEITEHNNIEFFFLHDKFQAAASELSNNLKKIHFSIAKSQANTSLSTNAANIANHIVSCIDIITSDNYPWILKILFMASESCIQQNSNEIALKFSQCAASILDSANNLTFDLPKEIYYKKIGNIAYLSGNDHLRDMYYQKFLDLSDDIIEKAEMYIMWSFQCFQLQQFQQCKEKAWLGLLMLKSPYKRNIFRTFKNYNTMKKIIYSFDKNPEKFFAHLEKKDKQQMMISFMHDQYAKGINYTGGSLFDGVANILYSFSKLIKSGYDPRIVTVIVSLIPLSAAIKNIKLIPILLRMLDEIMNRFGVGMVEKCYVNFVIGLYGSYFVRSWKKVGRDLIECADMSMRVGSYAGTMGYSFGPRIQFMYDNLKFQMKEIPEYAQNLSIVGNKILSHYLLDVFNTIQEFLTNTNHDRSENFSKNKRLKSVYKLLVDENNNAMLASFHGELARSAFILRDFQDASDYFASYFAKRNIIYGMISQAIWDCFFLIYYFPSIEKLGFKRKNLSELWKFFKTFREIRTLFKSSHDQFAMYYHLALAQMYAFLKMPFKLVYSNFQKAIEYSAKDENLCVEAIATEYLGRYLFKNKYFKLSYYFLNESCLVYERWGALAKIQALRDEFSAINSYPSKRSAASANNTSVNRLEQTIQNTAKNWANTTNLYANNQSKEIDAKALIKAASLISSEMKLSNLSAQIISVICQVSGSDFGALFLLEEDIFICRGIFPNNPLSLNIPINNSYWPIDKFQSCKINKSRIIIDSSEKINFDSLKRNIQCYVVIPVIASGKFLGVLHLESSTQKSFFHDELLTTIDVLVSQSAIAIENARSFQKIESIVAQRTRELVEKNRDIESILENLDEGIFTIDENLCLEPSYSKFLEKIFERNGLAGVSIKDLIFNASNLDAHSVNEILGVLNVSIKENEFNFIANKWLLPKEIKVQIGEQTKELELYYNSILDENKTVEKIMISLRDVTEIKKLRYNIMKQQHEISLLTEILIGGISSFEDILNDVDFYLNHSIKYNSQDNLKLLYRNLHTIKALTRSINLTSIVNTIHTSENYYSNILEGMDTFDKNKSLKELEKIIETKNQYVDVFNKYAKDHLRSNSASKTQSLQAILLPVIDSLQETAAFFNKPSPKIELAEDSSLNLSKYVSLIRNSCIHILNNCLAHGIEFPSQRKLIGKPLQGCINISSKINSNKIEITIKDDGSGLNLDKLSHLNRNNNLTACSDEIIANTIFEEQISTAETITEVAGRGMGLSAVKSMLEKAKGSIEIEFNGERKSGFRPFQFKIKLPI